MRKSRKFTLLGDVDIEGGMCRESHDCLATSFQREPSILPVLRKMEFVYYGEMPQRWRELMLSTYWFFRERGVLSLVVCDLDSRRI